MVDDSKEGKRRTAQKSEIVGKKKQAYAKLRKDLKQHKRVFEQHPEMQDTAIDLPAAFAIRGDLHEAVPGQTVT